MANKNGQKPGKRSELRTGTKKAAVLVALKKHLGVVKLACDTANVSRSQFYKWKDEDAAFAEAVEAVSEETLDFAESKLLSAISKENITAIIFFLKTKGKKRGYIEGQEVVNYTPNQAPVWLDGETKISQ